MHVYPEQVFRSGIRRLRVRGQCSTQCGGVGVETCFPLAVADRMARLLGVGMTMESVSVWSAPRLQAEW